MYYERREDVPEYVTPNEEKGIVKSIPTVNDGPEFENARRQQSLMLVEGNLDKYFENPDEVPAFVPARKGGSELSTLDGTRGEDGALMEMFLNDIHDTRKEFPPEAKKAMAAGHKFELPIAEKWCEDNYYDLLRPTGMLVDKDGFFCNIDYFARSREKGKVVILEIKYCYGTKHWHEVMRRVIEQLPAEPKYVTQVQLQCDFAGVDEAFIVYGCCGSRKALEEGIIDMTYAFPVKYDAERAKNLHWCLDTYARAVVTGDMDLLLTLPGATPKDFTIVYGEGEGEVVENDTKHQKAADAWFRATAAVASAERDIAEAEKNLRDLLGSHKRMVIRSGRKDLEITTKVRESKNWDTEKLQDIAPQVYAENTKFSITDAQLKKLPEDVREGVKSCLTIERKAVSGANIKELPR